MTTELYLDIVSKKIAINIYSVYSKFSIFLLLEFLPTSFKIGLKKNQAEINEPMNEHISLVINNDIDHLFREEC